MPFRSPPLLIPGGFGRKICIESESGLVTIRKGRGMKNISGSESESNWSGSVHTLRNSVRQRTKDRTFSKKWVHCLLKLDETSIWKGVGCLYSGISSRIGFFLQLGFNLIASRVDGVRFHIFRNDLWYSCVESFTRYFLMIVQWWKKMIEFRRREKESESWNC